MTDVPDHRSAARISRAVERVLWQRLEADGSHSTVAAIRRRRPVELRVTHAAALGLRAAGVPTIVARGADR